MNLEKLNSRFAQESLNQLPRLSKQPPCVAALLRAHVPLIPMQCFSVVAQS